MWPVKRKGEYVSKEENLGVRQSATHHTKSSSGAVAGRRNDRRSSGGGRLGLCSPSNLHRDIIHRDNLAKLSSSPVRVDIPALYAGSLRGLSGRSEIFRLRDDELEVSVWSVARCREWGAVARDWCAILEQARLRIESVVVRELVARHVSSCRVVAVVRGVDEHDRVARRVGQDGRDGRGGGGVVERVGRTLLQVRDLLCRAEGHGPVAKCDIERCDGLQPLSLDGRGDQLGA